MDADILKRQISLTEWFEIIKHNDSTTFRQEDSSRKDRLEVLKKVAKINYDAPTSFSATQVVNNTSKFKSFLKKHGRETCGLRLNPTDTSLPKLRLRGKTIYQSLAWLKEQPIDPTKYQLDFIPHSNRQLWSTIFVVNKQGICGEIIKGGHYQLTTGFYDLDRPITFTLRFSTNKLEVDSPSLLVKKHILEGINQVKIPSLGKQKKLKKLLQADFAHNYLCGYFETLRTKDFGLWLIDYNRKLGKLYESFVLDIKPHAPLSGRVGSQGKAKGKVKIIHLEEVNQASITSDEILVCKMTTPDYLPLMAKCGAIVTELGGVLSHAAIISRELKKPCLIAVNDVTRTLKNGDFIEVDAFGGTVKILN